MTREGGTSIAVMLEDRLDSLVVAVRVITIGGDRPPGVSGFDEFVDSARSELQISPRSAGDLAIVGYTSGTTGLPKGAMISQEALTQTIRLMPSMFRISSYGRCAFTGTLSFASGIWGVILPHLYTGGTVRTSGGSTRRGTSTSPAAWRRGRLTGPARRTKSYYN